MEQHFILAYCNYLKYGDIEVGIFVSDGAPVGLQNGSRRPADVIAERRPGGEEKLVDRHFARLVVSVVMHKVPPTPTAVLIILQPAIMAKRFRTQTVLQMTVSELGKI